MARNYNIFYVCDVCQYKHLFRPAVCIKCGSHSFHTIEVLEFDTMVGEQVPRQEIPLYKETLYWYSPMTEPSEKSFCLNEKGFPVYWNKHFKKWQGTSGNFTEVKAWCYQPVYNEMKE